MRNGTEDMIEMDLLGLLAALWRRIWLVAGVTLLSGLVALGGAYHLITPKYDASVLMYVNSSNLTLGGARLSISQNDLTAAKSLIDTYAVILKTRATLNDVIAEAGLSCTYEDLVEMVRAEAVNGTEVLKITITDPDPSKAVLTANTIAQVLPKKIGAIVEGSSVQIMDMAALPTQPSSPSYVKCTAVGMALGLLLAVGLVAVREMLDDKIHDADYLTKNYEIPVLAVIPDLQPTGREDCGSADYRSGAYGGIRQ